MAWSALLLILIFLLLLLLFARSLAIPLCRLIDNQPLRGTLWLEKTLVGCVAGNHEEMSWKQYSMALAIFNLLGMLLLWLMLMFQAALPLNPQQFPGLSWDLALNTAISFVTNTNWQAYSGETTLSYFSQMGGLTVQNFLSAATGIAVAFVLIRVFARHSLNSVGNFWWDLLRITLYILLPISLVMALFFVSEGVIQNFLPYLHLTTLEGAEQVVPMGPVASQEAIKVLGTNGGGFFNANSAHPFENPSMWSNLLQMVAICLIPAALCFAFGSSVKDPRQGHTLLWSMAIILVVSVLLVMHAETAGNAFLLQQGADSSGNMEGKEVRFGILSSSLYAVVTTATSCGAVNTLHDSLTPIGGMIPMWLIQLGEVIFGGVGSGLYSILLFVLLSVFIAGLMIGRTPEYLGKKIEAREMKMVAIAILVPPALTLIGTALAVSTEAGRAGILNPGPHGFSEVLYAYTSASNNNGSAFAGLSANTPFYNLTLAIAMLLGRFGVLLPVMAIAGSIALKQKVPPGSGTLPTHGPLFIGILTGSVLLIGALTFIPALALGPIVEQLTLLWANVKGG
ncbi:MAG: potassium-transporting ATPase subunit KdpA [Enterobacteriaceae bacterium]